MHCCIDFIPEMLRQADHSKQVREEELTHLNRFRSDWSAPHSRWDFRDQPVGTSLRSIPDCKGIQLRKTRGGFPQHSVMR